MNEAKRAQFHLPGLFEFYDFYRVFLPLYRTHREYFYDWCEIASIYGAPEGCLWGGGRVGCGNQDPHAVLALTQEYGLSARLTFSNSLLTKAHLADSVCNALCRLFSEADGPLNGVIIHSDLLLDYLRAAYPQFYFISSTTKVLTDFPQLRQELEREAFRFVVPDFRLNKAFDQLLTLPQPLKGKVEFLCNDCCWFGEHAPHRCTAPGSANGYRFSRAMENPGFLSVRDIQTVYLPLGFSNFKLEGRGLGSAMILEFLLYYLTKPDYQLRVREEIYLDAMLDLF